MVDKKFYLENENLKCPHCESNEIVILGIGEYSKTDIVKCSNCGVVMFEDDLEEKEEDSYIVPKTTR